MSFGLNHYRLIYYELFDILRGHQLGMPVINNLIDDLINQYEVFSDTFFVKDSAEVTEDFHHSVQDIHYIGWRNIMFSCCHKEYSKFFCVKVVYSVHIEAWRWVTLPEFDFTEEHFTCFSSEIQTN